MGARRTYPRHMGNLVVHKDRILADLSKVPDQHASTVMDNCRTYLKAGRMWFYITTGVFVQLWPWEDGNFWCVNDVHENSRQYRWLSVKARTYANYIVKRLNHEIEDMR